jgi:sulfur-oxidizing protein SoxX
LIANLSMKPAVILALLAGAALAGPAHAQSAAADGQKLADRSKGNCLTCHVIKGGDLAGTIGPELVDIKSNTPIATISSRF